MTKTGAYVHLLYRFLPSKEKDRISAVQEIACFEHALSSRSIRKRNKMRYKTPIESTSAIMKLVLFLP